MLNTTGDVQNMHSYLSSLKLYKNN